MEKKNKKLYTKTLVLPLSEDMMERLKSVSEKESISMNQLTREAIRYILKKYEKNS